MSTMGSTFATCICAVILLGLTSTVLIVTTSLLSTTTFITRAATCFTEHASNLSSPQHTAMASPTLPFPDMPRETHTGMNNWFGGRLATAMDCKWRCENPAAAWCDSYNFSSTGGGTCNLFEAWRQVRVTYQSIESFDTAANREPGRVCAHLCHGEPWCVHSKYLPVGGECKLYESTARSPLGECAEPRAFSRESPAAPVADEPLRALQLAATASSAPTRAARAFGASIIPYVATSGVAAFLREMTENGAIHPAWRPTPTDGRPVPPDAPATPGAKPGSLGLNWRNNQDAFTVACAASHRRVWARVLSEGWPHALVFEGDASWARGPLLDARVTVQRVLETVRRADPQWGIVNLGVSCAPHRPLIACMVEPREGQMIACTLRGHTARR